LISAFPTCSFRQASRGDCLARSNNVGKIKEFVDVCELALALASVLARELTD
jgi:hypothetical protein